jgi:hypothetical protein
VVYALMIIFFAALILSLVAARVADETRSSSRVMRRLMAPAPMNRWPLGTLGRSSFQNERLPWQSLAY